MSHGVVIAAGSGNNGGDGWIIARALHDTGVRVRVVECASAKTDDARAERALAVANGVAIDSNVDALLTGGEGIVVDALLGTGYSAGSPLRADMATAIAHIAKLGERGATVVAIDLPSGLDATTGEAKGDLRATFTFTFGTVKRGLLRARNRAGHIVVLDIGLGHFAEHAGTATLATPSWFRANLPVIAAGAHKGTRKKIAIVGGGAGMAGAVLLAARAALRSGAGLVKCFVDADSLLAVQHGEPAALAARWPETANEWRSALSEWADAVLIGPGLGRGHRAIVEDVLNVFTGPVVLDADALNVFEGDAKALKPLIGDRQALLTPHPLEFKRLSGSDDASPDAQRTVAEATGACVLLKGVPTVLMSPHGASMCVAEGNPILATGGAGDVLGGIAATLLAQSGNALKAGSLAAFAHGRAADVVSRDQVRGFTIDDVVDVLPSVWSLDVPPPRAPVLAELRAVRDST